MKLDPAHLPIPVTAASLSRFRDVDFRRSIVPILRDSRASIRDTALSIHGQYGLRSAKWAYIGNPAGKGILYDMIKDPGQFKNVASDPEYAEMLKEAHTKLKARLDEI